MRGLILGLTIMFFCGIAGADVTAKIIGIDKDDNGNIRIKTQYKIDGVEVQSKYPPLNGMYYWVTRYDVQSFAGNNKAQILSKVKKDIQSFEKSLIVRKFIEINNNAFVLQSQDLVNAVDTQTTTSIYVDTNQDNIPDTEWIIKTDGTKAEKPYTPIP